MTDRIPLAQHTKASLDQLYNDLDRYEEVVGELNTANTRLARQAARQEAAVTRVRALAARIRQGAPWTANDDDIAAHILRALDGDHAPTDASCSPGVAETEPNNPAATEATDVGTRIARAIHRYDNRHGLSGNDLPGKHHRGEADAVLAELRRELAALGEYENAITWHTDCLSCARVLDSAYAETVRAETAEAAITRVRAYAQTEQSLGNAITPDDLLAVLDAEQPERTTANNSVTSSDEADNFDGYLAPDPPIGCLSLSQPKEN